MCIKHIDYFDVCGHNGKDDVHVAAISEIEKCPAWDGEKQQSCKALRTRDVKHVGKCPACAGNEEREVLWYKHCFQSEICDHEYVHALTDLERYRNEEDIVLVTPTYGLCPDCEEAGYENQPGAAKLLKIASAMPKEFENLTRRPVEDVPRVSTMPSDDLTKVITSRRLDGSYVPTSTYKSAASRVPGSKEPSSSSRPSQVSRFTNQGPTQPRVPIHPQYPASSQAPRNQSQYQGESYQPSYYPASAAPSPKPATQVCNPVSQVPTGEASKKVAMSPADYLKRGPPKNVSTSAFYLNADGDDARARLACPSAALGYSPGPSSARQANISAPRWSERTHAPPADAEVPDVEELKSSASLAPNQSHQHPWAHPSKTPGGHKAVAAQALASQVPDASSVPRSEVPRHPQIPSSTSRISANNSGSLQSSALHNASRATEQPSTSRPSPSPRPQPGQTTPPGYKTVASSQSELPSKTLPQYSVAHSVDMNSNAARSTAPQPTDRNGDQRRQISSISEENEEGRSQ